jgi:uncharacterized coiled-coil protein SlyX
MISERTRIANPIYDGAFKYLLDDNRVARFFLSVLLGEDVVDLQLRPTEHCSDVGPRCLTVFRIDFAARIRCADGTEKLVIIEIQKAKYATDIMRFRKYLGQQYASDNNVQEDAPPAPRALPILSIYLLGHKLDHILEPVIRVTREYRDTAGRTINGPREPFIESLTHDSIVVQIPLLKARRQTDLERLLGLFDQSQAEPANIHLLSISDEDYPDKFQPVIRRLMKAISEPVVRNVMQVEDEVLNELERLERHIASREDIIARKEDLIAAQNSAIAEKNSALAEKNSALAAQSSALAEKNSAIAEKNSALAEKDSALAAQQAQLERAIHRLVATGMSLAEAEHLILG